MADHMAARNRGLFLTGQVERDSLSPTRNLHGVVVDLNAAYPKSLIAWQAPYPIPGSNFAAERGSGNDQTVALKHEGTVHRQTKIAARDRFLATVEHLMNQGTEFAKSLTGHGRKGKDRRIF